MFRSLNFFTTLCLAGGLLSACAPLTINDYVSDGEEDEMSYLLSKSPAPIPKNFNGVICNSEPDTTELIPAPATENLFLERNEKKFDYFEVKQDKSKFMGVDTDILVYGYAKLNDEEARTGFQQAVVGIDSHDNVVKITNNLFLMLGPPSEISKDPQETDGVAEIIWENKDAMLTLTNWNVERAMIVYTCL